MDRLLRGFVGGCDGLLWVLLQGAVAVALARERAPKRVRSWTRSLRRLLATLAPREAASGGRTRFRAWNRTSPQLEEEIVRLHVALPELGAGQLRTLAARVLGFRACRQTFRAILIRRRPLIAELRNRKRRQPREIRVAKGLQLWGVDLTLVWLLGFWPIWVLAAVDYYGSPARLLTDRGVQFSGAEFRVFVERNDVTHTRTWPAHPWTNGRVERLFGTFKTTLSRYVRVARSAAHLARFCAEFREWHNTHRPHSSWDGRTPDEVFFERPRQLEPLGRIRFFDGQLHWWRFG